jgi:hypothetical protein
MRLNAVAIAGFCPAKRRKEHFQCAGKSGKDAGNRGFFEGADQEVQTATKRCCGGLTFGRKIWAALARGGSTGKAGLVETTGIIGETKGGKRRWSAR